MHTLLPPPFNVSPSPPTLVAQGAEALVFRTVFVDPAVPCALKYRPPKPYRHPILDRRLTRARLLSEARVLLKCKKDFTLSATGPLTVDVPALLGVDWEAGWLVTEWIPGRTIRACLDAYLHTLHTVTELNSDEQHPSGAGALWDLMRRVGRAVGRLHDIGVVHGDLTTSNLMLTPCSPGTGTEASLDGTIALIDFGLATQSVQDEDRAVDLYVLERAFSATHPSAEPLFQELLNVYGQSFKGANIVLKRLEDVRARGRKKSMIG